MRAASLAALLIVVAGYLDGKGNLADAVDEFLRSTRSSGADLLSYVAPPYVAVAVIGLIVLLCNATRERWLATVARIVVVVAVAAHTVGLARLVDRTPRHFPWVVMTILGLGTVAAVVTLVVVSRRHGGTRKWGILLVAYAVLLLPLSVSYVATGRPSVAHGLHWLAHAALGLIGLACMRRGDAPIAPASATRRHGWGWAVAALGFAAAVALPIWPRLDVVRLIEETGERCTSELEFGSLWQIIPAADSVCPDQGGLWVVAGNVAAVALLAAVAVILLRRRKRERG